MYMRKVVSIAVTTRERKNACIICGCDLDKHKVGYICNGCRDKITK